MPGWFLHFLAHFVNDKKTDDKQKIYIGFYIIGVYQAQQKICKKGCVTAEEGFQPTTLFTPKGVKIELMTSAQYL